MIRCRHCRYFNQVPRKKLLTCSQKGKRAGSIICSKFSTDIRCIFCKTFKECKETTGALGTICRKFEQKYSCADCILDCKSPKNKICNKFIVFDFPKKESYKLGMLNILEYTYRVESALQSTVEKVQSELEKAGMPAQFQEARLTTYVDRLLSIATFTMLINLLGLEQYKKKLVESEIEKIWGGKLERKKNKLES